MNKLVQCAAVAVAWIECGDRREAHRSVIDTSSPIGAWGAVLAAREPQGGF